MNKMKKIIAFALMMVMMMAMSVTAFAAEATITVENVGKDATLTYEQVIVADQTTSSGWEIVSGYEAAFQKLPGMENEKDTQKLIEAYNKAKESEKAEALANISTSKEFTNGMTVTSAGLYVINATEEGFTYKTMAAYVGFDEKTGEQKGLTPATLKAKKEPTKVGKTADEKYVEINDEIKYTLKATIPYVPEDKVVGNTTTSSEVTLFAINDKMTGGKYKVETEGENAGKLAVKISYGTTEETVYVDVVNNGFKLDLSKLVNKQNTNANLELTAEYTAIATSLKINNNAYPTVLNHKYDIDKDGKDITTKITSFSGKINLVKVDANNTSTKLAGAQFVIGKKNTDGSVVYAKLNNGQLVGWTSNKEANGEEAGASHIITDENGEAGAAGFDKDITTYFVEEVAAPQGYALNNTKYPIKWNESVEIEAVQEGTTDSAIPNTKLGQLPFTGGMGTTIFTVLGVALMAIAAALYFATKRTAKN